MWPTDGTRLLDVIYSLPIVFHIENRNSSEPVEKFTDLKRFQSLISDLISTKTEINSGLEAD
jgi:hypothetical protein